VDRVRLPGSTDTRVLVAGVAAFLALVAYVGVAYANTHATNVTTEQMAQKLAEELSPWTPNASNLVPVPSGKVGGTAVRVSPTALGTYEAYVPTLVYQPPPGRRFVVSLWLRGPRAGQTGGNGSNSGAGRVAVNVTEQGLVGSGEAPLSEVNTTVPLKTGWHRFTFRGKVEGRRLSLAIYLYRNIYRRTDLSRTWFDVRGLAVKLR
jgi:hypothetical protein